VEQMEESKTKKAKRRNLTWAW